MFIIKCDNKNIHEIATTEKPVIQVCENEASGYFLDFNITNQDYVEVPYDATLALSGEVTLEAWVRINNFTASQQQYFIYKWGATDAEREYSLYYDHDGTDDWLKFEVHQETPSGVDVEVAVAMSSLGISTNQWFHIAATLDGTDANIYIDGVLQGTNSSTITQINDNTNSLFLARTDNTDGYLDGALDEVRIWSVKRTETEINQTMNCTLSGNETGLIAYYDMNSSTGNVVSDISGNGHDSTLYTNDVPDWVLDDKLIGCECVTGP